MNISQSENLVKEVKNPLINILRFILAIALAFLGFFLITLQPGDMLFPIGIVFVIIVPIIFFMFFSIKKLIKNPKLALTSKDIRIFYFIIFFVCIGLVLFRWNYVKTNDDGLEVINSTVLTMDDVMGANLPPEPDQALNDSTIAGIDANNNMIRDDIELKIFEKYLKKAKMRAAMLQYAQALQLEMTQVNSEEVMKTYLEKYSSAYSCLSDAVESYNDSNDPKFLYQVKGDTVDEIVNLVLNTEERREQFDAVYKKYMTSFGTLDKKCDIDLSSLAN